MGWICGSHLDAQGKVVQRVIADGEPCDRCNPPVSLKASRDKFGADVPARVLKRGTVGRGDNPITVVPP